MRPASSLVLPAPPHPMALGALPSVRYVGGDCKSRTLRRYCAVANGGAEESEENLGAWRRLYVTHLVTSVFTYVRQRTGDCAPSTSGSLAISQAARGDRATGQLW